MGSLPSESASDHQSDICGSYSPSADVSESETSSSFSYRRYDGDGVASAASFASSPLRLSQRNAACGDFLFPSSSRFEFPLIGPKNGVLWDEMPFKRQTDLSEIDKMKERFAKLLLGEDMSGGGKGVCTALAISNAITNLSASVFGELWRLEPLAPQKKAMWSREMEWLLCVSDSIIELVPSVQQFPGGGTYEVMTPQPRSDLHMNLPALKKLDAMLISILDGFRDMEFWYVDRGIVVGDEDIYDAYSSPRNGRPSVRQEEKWWLPCPKVPPTGLSDEARKKLQQCRDCTNQILKAALAINSNTLAEMEIPAAYLETLPKSGKACLGETIYRYITADQFSPEHILDSLDLSSDHRAQEIANRLEAAVHLLGLKDRRKHSNHHKTQIKTWGGKVKGLVDGDRNQFLAQRAEVLLRNLRIRFPSLPQSALDMHKIQYNKDVGHSILESYSRIVESLAFNIVARIDDVFYVDDATKQCAAESAPFFNRGSAGGLPIRKRMSPSPFSVQPTPYTSPFATPTVCSSPGLPGSPRKGTPNDQFDKLMPLDLKKLWSYASATRLPSEPPERD